MLELYKRIRQRRIELDMSQEELGKMLGYKSRSSINKIELGENDIPQSKIVEFAKALRTTPSWLMGWDKAPALWEEAFCKYVVTFLENTNLQDLAAAKADGVDVDYILWSIGPGKLELSFEEACDIADQLGLSIDEIVGRQSKKPANISIDGLSEKKQLLIELLVEMDDDDAEALIAAADALKARRKK